MGQQASSVCCCCCGGGDKRASEVLNDSLQEKLLDEETNVTVDTRQSSEHVKLKQSSTRHAGVATTDEDDEDARMSEQRKANEEIEGDEDQFDELYQTKSKSTARDHTGSSYNTSNAWDLSQDSQVDFESSLHSQQQEFSSSDLSLMGARIADLSMGRLESEASVRSNREDSYASSNEEATELQDEQEEEEEKEKLPPDSLRRRSVARPSSSRVFDDESEPRARGLTELSDQGEDSQGFGSYGSNSSLLQSFVIRDSDGGSTTSFADSQRLVDDATAPTAEEEDTDKTASSTSHSPRHTHKKKKKKGNHSPRGKHR